MCITLPKINALLKCRRPFWTFGKCIGDAGDRTRVFRLQSSNMKWQHEKLGLQHETTYLFFIGKKESFFIGIGSSNLIDFIELETIIIIFIISTLKNFFNCFDIFLYNNLIANYIYSFNTKFYIFDLKSFFKVKKVNKYLFIWN